MPSGKIAYPLRMMVFEGLHQLSPHLALHLRKPRARSDRGGLPDSASRLQL